ncbi:hypothetical protein Tco_1022806 [Tanacetum coccineum]
MKQLSYYSIDRNHCISSPIKSKRFSTAKGRLDFDVSEMAPSDILTSEQDMNAPGPNSVTSVKSVTKCIKVSSPGVNDVLLPGEEFLMKREIFFGSTGMQDVINTYNNATSSFAPPAVAAAGPYSVTSVKSVTKCIKVFSPIKSRKSTRSGHKTCDADQVVDYIANMVHV